MSFTVIGFTGTSKLPDANYWTTQQNHLSMKHAAMAQNVDRTLCDVIYLHKCAGGFVVQKRQRKLDVYVVHS